MTATTGEALKAHQHEVQQLLGLCILKLQQCEKQIKKLVVLHDISGTVHSLESNIDNQTSRYAKRTLGNLVGELLGSYIIWDKTDAPPEPKDAAPDAPLSVSMKFKEELPDADYAKVECDLKAFVSIRNDLVHHFNDQHDLWSVAGCVAAKDALEVTRSLIDKHFGQLKEWAKDMDHARKEMVRSLETDIFNDLLLNGINPDGTVVWPCAGIVRALREAAAELAADGWASIDRAGEWIAMRYPEQLPAKYGCRSWRQVVHESRQFDLKKLEANGARTTFFRKKVYPAH